MRRKVACKMFVVWSVPTLSRKWYLRYLAQTVHSNSKTLFPLTKEEIVNLWFNGKILQPVDFQSSGQLQNVGFSKNFSYKSSLEAYAGILSKRIQNKENSCFVASCQPNEHNNDQLTEEKSIG